MASMTSSQCLSLSVLSLDFSCVSRMFSAYNCVLPFQGLKRHSVTMFEVGKLTDESMDSLLQELEKVSHCEALVYTKTKIGIRSQGNKWFYLSSNIHSHSHI